MTILSGVSLLSLEGLDKKGSELIEFAMPLSPSEERDKLVDDEETELFGCSPSKYSNTLFFMPYLSKFHSTLSSSLNTTSLLIITFPIIGLYRQHAL